MGLFNLLITNYMPKDKGKKEVKKPKKNKKK